MLRRLGTLYLLLILSASCLKTTATPEQIFGLQLKEVMMTAQELDSPLFSPFEESELTHPVGTWLWLMEIDSRYCLFYRTPLGEKLGELRLNERPEAGCREAFRENVVVALEDVQALNFIELNHRERKLGPRQEWVIEGEHQAQEFRWKIFAPLVAGEKGQAPKKLSSFAARTIGPDSVYDKPRKGEYRKRYSDGEALFCHRVDENCEDVESFSCQSCRYGWYEVVDYSCPQGGSKICGPSRCGQRGEPACPRGLKHISQERSEIVVCEKDSKAGFCEQGLETHCDENNVLICL